MMFWTPGQWLTRCEMRATVAKIETERGKWIIRGAICCPSSGALAIAEWDHGGNIQKISGALTNDPDFDLTEHRYTKEMDNE